MKPFAIYFPQFYPTATNDKAWGSGFTDWALVANANMRDLWSRRAPALGFYDGSSPLVHSRQIIQAKAANLGGFAVYHYWFYTHQELNAFELTISSTSASELTIPWFLIWATESWSKRWLGNSKSLINLTANPTLIEIEQHCNYLATCFSHPLYKRWRGKPLFVLYNLEHFDYPESVVLSYRKEMLRRGFDIAVAHFVKNPFDLIHCSYTDATYLFEPRLFFGFMKVTRGILARSALSIFKSLAGRLLAEKFLIFMDRYKLSPNHYSQSSFLEYMESRQRASFLSTIKQPYQEVLSPGWNNIPRYGKYNTRLDNLDPAIFSQLLATAMGLSDLPPLINAWNEWSEGAAVEPCAYLGSKYLDSIAASVNSFLGII